MNRRVAFKTLGCRLNQSETDSLLTDFYKANYEIVGFNDNADVYIINTCTVTNQSDHKSKTIINQACKRDGSPVIVVTGCMADNQKEDLGIRNNITYIVPNRTKSAIFSLIDSHFKGEIMNPDSMKEGLFNFSVAEKSFHTRSFIKINDGCNNSCSYCIVPKVRGKAISRPPGDILDNIRKVVDLGYKEVVLTGVNISCYNFDNVNFEDLIEKVLNVPGDFRVRISSLEPEGFGEKLVALFDNPKLCPHLHLCLQSGSDNILMKMKRVYNLESYLKIIELLKSKCPDINFTTDIIVGFPGESDKDFLDSCKVIKDVGFSHVHTFKYSIRKGTFAEHFPEHVPENVKAERSKKIREISDENKLAYRKSIITKTQRVLVEKITKEGQAMGYGENYVPVIFNSEDCIINSFKMVRISGITEANNMVLNGNTI